MRVYRGDGERVLVIRVVVISRILPGDLHRLVRGSGVDHALTDLLLLTISEIVHMALVFDSQA